MLVARIHEDLQRRMKMPDEIAAHVDVSPEPARDAALSQEAHGALGIGHPAGLALSIDQPSERDLLADRNLVEDPGGQAREQGDERKVEQDERSRPGSRGVGRGARAQAFQSSRQRGDGEDREQEKVPDREDAGRQSRRGEQPERRTLAPVLVRREDPTQQYPEQHDSAPVKMHPAGPDRLPLDDGAAEARGRQRLGDARPEGEAVGIESRRSRREHEMGKETEVAPSTEEFADDDDHEERDSRDESSMKPRPGQKHPGGEIQRLPVAREQ